jgi:hypothetical protein
MKDMCCGRMGDMKRKTKDVRESREETVDRTGVKTETKALGDKGENVKKKKKIRTKIICGIIVLLIISIIYNEVLPFFISPREIQELNKNINLPFKFGEPLEKYNFAGKEWNESEGPYGIYYTNINGDYYGFEGFPDLSQPYKLTYCETSNKKYRLFGIQIGDSIEIADDQLKKYGYKYNKSYEEYRKGRIKILIAEEETTNQVNGIVIILDSTDWLRKGYYK